MDHGQCPLALPISIRDGHRTQWPEERASAPVLSALFIHPALDRSNRRHRRAAAERGDWIAAGDSFYLGGLRRLGTQRALTVEAIGPVLASMGGVLMMGDTVRPAAWAGALLVSCAVVLVAQQSKASSATNGTAFGLLLCVLAVMCGLSGAFLSRHVLITSSLSPMQTAAIRLLGGWLGLLPLLRGRLRPKHLPKGVMAKVVLATLLGTNLGIVLQQVVFQMLPVGQGITLMSTAPVMALFLHRLEGESLQWQGIVAGLLAVSGVALSSL